MKPTLTNCNFLSITKASLCSNYIWLFISLLIGRFFMIPRILTLLDVIHHAINPYAFFKFGSNDLLNKFLQKLFLYNWMFNSWIITDILPAKSVNFSIFLPNWNLLIYRLRLIFALLRYGLSYFHHHYATNCS